MPGDIRSFFKPADQSTKAEDSVRDARAPSQKQARRDDAPTTYTQANPSKSNFPNAQMTSDSFTSTVSAGSMRPFSCSQSSLNSNGSRRTIQNGKQVVLDSDSDSDLDAYEELDFGLSTKKAPEPPRKSPGKPMSTRLLLRNKVEALPKPPKPSKSTNSSLSKLLETVRRDAEKEEKMASLRAVLEKPPEVIPDTEVIDENDLIDVIEGKDAADRSKRLYRAMQRTNMEETETVYHFFGESASDNETRPAPFPIRSLPNQGWTACFEDSNSRNQLFLSGFAKQVFEHQKLPEELSTWIVDQLCSGQTSALTAKYLELLEMHPRHLERILDKSAVNNLFKNMGADVQCLDREVQPSDEFPDDPKRPIPHQLQSVLELLYSAGKWLQPAARKHALLLLMHLCFDDSVLANPSVLHSVQRTIEALMRYIPDRDPMLNDIAQTLLFHIHHPVLQNIFITSFPLTSPMTASFRRHLALAFLLHPSPIPTSSTADLTRPIHTALDKSPHLHISRTTNYSLLASAVSLLDTAIGPGPALVPCRPPPTPGSSPETFLTKEEATFNKHIDVLVQHIRLLGNGIVEAGAISDPSRLAAKGNMDALCHRLENAARIGGRRKRMLFHIDEGESGAKASKRIFGKWLGKGRKKGGEGSEASNDAVASAGDEGASSEGGVDEQVNTEQG